MKITFSCKKSRRYVFTVYQNVHKQLKLGCLRKDFSKLRIFLIGLKMSQLFVVTFLPFLDCRGILKPVKHLRWNFLWKKRRLLALAIFAKNSILDVWLGSESACKLTTNNCETNLHAQSEQVKEKRRKSYVLRKSLFA